MTELAQKLYMLGTDDDPAADVHPGHISKAEFRKKWNEEWDGDEPGDDVIDYAYAVPPTDPEADGAKWEVGVDATIGGAVPITIFVW